MRYCITLAKLNSSTNLQYEFFIKYYHHHWFEIYILFDLFLTKRFIDRIKYSRPIIIHIKQIELEQKM